MNFKALGLKNELYDGLLQYQRDTGVSPDTLIESLIEDFLYREEYLIVGAGDEEVPFPEELNRGRIKYAYPRHDGSLQIRRQLGKLHYNYCNCTYEYAKPILDFLISKDWDIKYSTKNTGLRGKKQLEFLLGEIEKEKGLIGE